MPQPIADSSYPPLFRQTHPPTSIINDPDESERSEHVLNPPSPSEQEEGGDPLPVIDFQCIDKEKLSSACRDWGIFRLVNHGIPPTLLNRLHEHAGKIFGLEFESKKRLFSEPPVSYFWGTAALTPGGAALLSGGLDWAEALHVQLSQLGQLEPEETGLRVFRDLLDEYGNRLSAVAGTVFEAMAETLSLRPEQTASYLSLPTGFLRVYRYPRCSAPDENVWGMGVHTDSSMVSVLSQDGTGGLQVVGGDGVWIDVKPVAGTLLVHLGDMMQAISDDKYKSVKHRVKVSKHRERIAIGYFVFPVEDRVIQTSLYRPFTYSEFRAQVQQDLKTVGFKVGLQRFKLDEAR